MLDFALYVTMIVVPVVVCFIGGYLFAGGFISLPELATAVGHGIAGVARFISNPLQFFHRSRYPILLRRGTLSLELCVQDDWSINKIEGFANDEFPIPGVQRWQCNLSTDATSTHWHDVHQCTRCRRRRHVKLSAC